MNVTMLTQAVTKLEEENNELRQRIKDAQSVLLCAVIANPQSVCDTASRVLDGDYPQDEKDRVERTLEVVNNETRTIG